MSILARPGTPLDGTAAVVLYGYGGYGISLAPTFVPARLPWLEHGGVFVVANIRGGGEYGEAWHHAGRLDVKQHCFDDFIACAEHLVATGVTRRDRLGIMGGSNGGLLVGAVVTQRPELTAAVVCAVPVLDALRSETTPNGEFNTTEFGSVADPDMFRALLAYSPVPHNVHDGTRYPPMLLTAGELDPTRRHLAREKDGRPAAGGEHVRSSDPPARRARRARHGPVTRPARRAEDRLLLVPLRHPGHGA